jgi:UDP-N-acetyl-D-mannosaminuronic acid dehydrogenase
MKSYFYDVCIVGGAGHVGFPLGLIFSSINKKVVLFDRDEKALDLISNGKIPFKEKYAVSYLKKYKKNIILSSDFNIIKSCKNIIICIGTPIKKDFSPDLKPFFNFFYQLKKIINSNQQIIIRSSIYIGSAKKIKKILKTNNITYCPERIVQGLSLQELPKLPQIVSGYSKRSIRNVSDLFKQICKKIIITTVQEAELIKLFSNAYRYINFSISNEFYTICQNLKINFSRIRNHMRDGYSRNAPIATAGFASGPCLLKDTLQISNYFKSGFQLGLSAVKVNENMPNFIFKQLKKSFDLRNKVIGVLGLAFKAETDDIRDSLSIKFIEILKKNNIKFFQSDEYYHNSETIDKSDLIKKSDIIVIGVEHKKYKRLSIPKNKIVVNMWE